MRITARVLLYLTEVWRYQLRCHIRLLIRCGHVLSAHFFQDYSKGWEVFTLYWRVYHHSGSLLST
jgi:hypothetical protein